MAIWHHDGAFWRKVYLRNTHRELSAIIVCNGPSLSTIDTRSLCGPGRIVIALNSAYPKVFPDYWLGMDDADCYNAGLWREAFPKILRGNYGEMSHGGRLLREMSQTWFADVSEKPKPDSFIWFKDTLRIAIQFAQWLGCRDLIFAGCDLDNSSRDYADDNRLTAEQRAANQRLYDQQLAWIKSSGLSPCVTVCDTRLREVMPFVPLAEVLERCERSRLSVPPPRPHVLATSPEHEREKYRGIYSEPSTAYGHSNHGADAIPLLKDCRSLLDVGCGHNEFVTMAREQLPGIRALGVDFACPGADMNASATLLPLPDKSFDTVTAFDMLEHLLPEQVDPALAEFARVARGFIFSIAHTPSRTTWHGANLHPTVQPEDWWLERIRHAGGSPEKRGRYIAGKWNAQK